MENKTPKISLEKVLAIICKILILFTIIQVIHMFIPIGPITTIYGFTASLGVSTLIGNVLIAIATILVSKERKNKGWGIALLVIEFLKIAVGIVIIIGLTGNL